MWRLCVARFGAKKNGTRNLIQLVNYSSIKLARGRRSNLLYVLGMLNFLIILLLGTH